MMVYVTLLVGFIYSITLVQADPRTELRNNFYNTLKGKTVDWAPITLGNPIRESWTVPMRENFKKYGINFIVRDPNFDSNKQLQAVTSIINEKPDVLIVQNPNVSLLARELKRAMDKGIYVIQVGMMSNQLTDVHIIDNSTLIGQLIAEEIVAECGAGKSSGKVAFI